jgi:hypothetical protein
VSAMAGLTGVECVECRAAGHRCQAQIWIENEPLCMRCADHERCCFDTAKDMGTPDGADEEVDLCVVPAPDRPVERLRHRVVVTPPRFEYEERAMIRCELTKYSLADVARRHSLDAWMIADLQPDEAARETSRQEAQAKLVRVEVERRQKLVIDGEMVMMAPGVTMGAEMIECHKKPVTIALVQTAVCDYFAIGRDRLEKHFCGHKMARRRQIAMFISYRICDKTLTEIGIAFGGFHHTTVAHALRTIEKNIPRDAELNKYVETIEAALDAGNVAA